MIDRFLKKHGIRLTEKGQRWRDNFEGTLMALIILALFVIVGTIEAGL